MASSEGKSKASFPDLQPNLDILKSSPPQENTEDSTEDVHRRIKAGHCIRQILLDASSAHQGKDQFRVHHGFQALLTALATMVHLESDSDADAEQRRLVGDYLQTLFGILSAALQDHRGNQRFFRKRVDGGGWQSLKRALLQLLLPLSDAKTISLQVPPERVFGCLLACALNDEFVITFFSDFKNSGNNIHEGVVSQTSPSNKHESSRTNQFGIRESANPSRLTTAVDAMATVRIPEALSIMLELWEQLETDTRIKDQRELTSFRGVPAVIRHIASLSTHNLLALHTTPLLGTLLSCLLSLSPQTSGLVELRSLAVSLLQLGVTSLDDAHLLYRYAASSPMIAELLLAALKMSHSPPYIHFDLSAHGFASVELPGIGRAFPPTSPSAGYTLTLWLNVVNFDPKSHTTLFGAFDSSQTCFMLIYLEKDTRNLILQTSVTSSRPSVRFKSITFRDNRWYHVAIVHRRPRTTMSSRASLFIDGEFIEQVKSNYPAPPPSVAPSLVGTNSGRRSHPIQAFFGTPQDLATRIGKGLVFSQWRLASGHLFGEALSDDLLAVYYQLGPKYHGNYQDRLGSFQTNEASAALNLRNESLHPGKEDKSEIVTAVRQFASVLLPESQIILNISPTAVLDDDENYNINEKQLVKGLGKQASKNLRQVTRGRNALAINGAIPAINEALHHSSGFAILTGNPTVVAPQYLDDAAWRIGGCAAVGLSLIEAAETRAGINNALNILLESVKSNWRNSEAMERENGFGVLATLLAKKLDYGKASSSDNSDQHGSGENVHEEYEKLSIEVLMTVLEFVGYRPEKPRDSVINNPLAYRVLLVDPDLWRNSIPAVQRLYYKQFVVFGADSKYHLFNAKRLSKMRKCSTISYR